MKIMVILFISYLWSIITIEFLTAVLPTFPVVNSCINAIFNIISTEKKLLNATRSWEDESQIREKPPTPEF